MNEAEQLILRQARHNRRRTWWLLAMGVANILVLAYVALQLTGSAQFAGTVVTICICGVFVVWGMFEAFIVRITGARKPREDELRRIRRVMRPLTAAIAMPEPEVLVIDDFAAANAFSVQKAGKKAVVAYTTGLLRVLDDDQLEAVTAHELAHLANRDTRLAAFSAALVGWALVVFVLGSVAMASALLLLGMITLGSTQAGCLGLLFALLLWVILIALAIISFGAWAALLIWMLSAKGVDCAMSRQREWLADATAAWMTRNPLALATALEKIDSRPVLKSGSNITRNVCIANPAQSLFGVSFRTHPPTEERIARLRRLATLIEADAETRRAERETARRQAEEAARLQADEAARARSQHPPTTGLGDWGMKRLNRR